MLGNELLLPSRRELVILGALIVLGTFPLRPDPPALLEPVQRRVQRPRLHLENFGRPGPNRLRDCIAMLRPGTEALKNNHIERALQHLDPVLIWLGFWHVDILHAWL